MKVLMFGWELPPFNSGGLGVACYGLSRALSENTDVIFVLPHKVNIDADFLKLMFTGNLKITTIDSPLVPYISADQYTQLKDNISLYGTDLFKEVERYAREARKIAEREEFDVIHAHDWLSFGAGIAAKEVSGKPLVAQIHSTEFDRSGGNNINKKVFEIEKKGMQKADKIITVSNFTRNIVEEKYLIKPEIISVVHNRINADEYRRGEDKFSRIKIGGKKIVLFAGRITLQKGPDYFLKVAQRILGVDKNVLFIMAGRGDMEREIINEVARMGISEKVLFTGFLKDKELSYLYRMADVFVMPSVSEPFGIVALESILNGTPVVISKQSGVSEVITNAIKVDYWDIDEMTNKIIAILSHSSLHKTLQVNGREEIKKFNWNMAAKDCEKIYKQLAK